MCGGSLLGKKQEKEANLVLLNRAVYTEAERFAQTKDEKEKGNRFSWACC